MTEKFSQTVLRMKDPFSLVWGLQIVVQNLIYELSDLKSVTGESGVTSSRRVSKRRRGILMEWQTLRRRLRFHSALTGLFLLKYAYLSALNNPEPSLNFFLFQTYNEGFYGP